MTAVPLLRRPAPAGDRLIVGLQVLGAIVIGLGAAFVAATMDPLVAVTVAGGLALILLSIRWPTLSLFVFVALVPIEEAINISGLGTLSRWAGIVFAGVYALPRLGQLIPRALPLAGWAYVGWAVLSLSWALDPSTAQGELQTLVQLALIGFLIADVVIHDPRSVRPLLWTYSTSAAATAAIGITLYLVGGVTDGRTAALAGQNPAQFASLLLPALIFALHEALQGRHALAAGLVSLFCSAGIILSGTRSVWLAATIVVFLLLLPRFGIRRAVVTLTVVAVFGIALLQVPGVASLVADRAETATTSGGAGRTDIWAVGIGIFESSPVIGVGYANFPVAFTSSLIRSANVTTDIGTGRGPHNVIVGTAGELGIVGLILLALFIVPLVLRRGWGPDGLVVQAILASLMIDALFLDILSNRKQVWIVIGLAAGLAYLAKRERRRAAIPGAASAREARATGAGGPPLGHSSPGALREAPSGGTA